MEGKYSDEIADLNPRSWLSKYRQTSILYLTKMALFYHGFGFLLAIIGIVIVQQIIPGYEVPIIPITIVEALSAGPLEEALFFGIPFYATGNHLVVLATGILPQDLKKSPHRCLLSMARKTRLQFRHSVNG